LLAFSIRVLVVDDYEPFRRFLCSILQNEVRSPTIVEASDGVQAIEIAQALRPDLILLDIGLPKLNGIDAARRIREFAPQSKILFVSQESSVDVVQAAFSVGASGYVVKADAARELRTAVKAVWRGERFVGIRFAGHGFIGPSDARAPQSAQRNKNFVLFQGENKEVARRHEAAFYSDDASFLEGFTQFVGVALSEGNAVIVVATESHRDSLLPRLQRYGLDITAAIEQGRYIPLDAADTLSTFMVNDSPDRTRFLEATADLITRAAAVAKGEHPRVAVCGECEPPLWMLGNGEAAIRLEQLWNEIAGRYDIDILCGYPLGSFYDQRGSHVFQRICGQHSAVYSR
jgi:DNA-binding NarL/FixJ family response regulator